MSLRAILDEITILSNSIAIKPIPPAEMMHAVRLLIEETYKTTDARTHLDAVNTFIAYIAP